MKKINNLHFYIYKNLPFSGKILFGPHSGFIFKYVYVKNGYLHSYNNNPSALTSYNKHQWHYNGKEINCKSSEEFEKYINLMAFD